MIFLLMVLKMTKALIIDRNTKNGWTDVHTPAEHTYELYMRAQDQIEHHRKLISILENKRKEYACKKKIKAINRQITTHKAAIGKLRNKRDKYLPLSSFYMHILFFYSQVLK
jgi:hypothetical protein